MPQHRVYFYRQYEEQSSLVYYLKQPVTVIDSRSSDLFWGSRLRPGRNVLGLQQFRAIAATQPAVVIVSGRDGREFEHAMSAGDASGWRLAGTFGSSYLYRNR